MAFEAVCKLFCGFDIFNMLTSPAILAQQTFENYVLILLNAGSGNSLNKTWNNDSDQRFQSGYKKKRYEVFHTTENYRSSLIDEWNLNPPSKLILQFLNDFGDVLLLMEFNNDESETSSSQWHQVSNIEHSNLHCDPSQVEFHVSDLFEFVLREQDTSLSWYGMTNSSNDGYGGKFIMTKNYTSPHALKLDLSSAQGVYEGCYQYVSSDNHGQQSKDLCFQTCISSNSEAVLFGYPHGSCACGQLGAKLTQFNHQCDTCTDDSSYLCGIVGGMYAVYDITGTALSQSEHDPRVNLTEGVEETIVFQINERVRIFEANNSDRIYITGFRLHIPSATPIEYTFHYATKYTNHTLYLIDFYKDGSYQNPISEQIYNITVIPATEIEIRFVGDITSYTGNTASMELYGFAGSDFIEAPWLIIDGIWINEDTTTVEYSTEIMETSTLTHPSSTTASTTDSEINTSTDLSSRTSSSPTNLASSTVRSNYVSTMTSVSKSTESTYITMVTDTHESTSSTAAYSTTSTYETVQPSHHTSDSSECSTCSCHVTINLDIEVSPEIQEKMDILKKNLTIPKKTLSSYLRTKTSAKDDRPSSQSLGSMGVIAIVFAVTVVILIDALNYYSYLKVIFNQVRHFLSSKFK